MPLNSSAVTLGIVAVCAATVGGTVVAAYNWIKLFTINQEKPLNNLPKSRPNSVSENPYSTYQAISSNILRRHSAQLDVNVESEPTKAVDSLLLLIYSIAEDQARKEGYSHRGVTCNNCGKSPIRGLRFRCCNCVDYDLCVDCESLNVHSSAHVFLKIRIPIPPLANQRIALLKPMYPGTIWDGDTLTNELVHSLLSSSHFDRIELDALYEQYKSLATSKDGIPRSIFDKCLGPLGAEKNLIVDRVFRFFDKNGDDKVCFEEFVTGLSVLCKGSLDEKIAAAYNGYDLEGNGRISRDSLHQMFKAYFRLSMELVRDVVKAMEEEMMETFDEENNKPVSAAFTAPIPTSPDHNTFNDPNIQFSQHDSDLPLSINTCVTVDDSSQLNTPSTDATILTAQNLVESTLEDQENEVGLLKYCDDVTIDHRRISATWEHTAGNLRSPNTLPISGEDCFNMNSSTNSRNNNDFNNFCNNANNIQNDGDNKFSSNNNCSLEGVCIQPAMEKMGQEAIAEMVEKIFQSIDVTNKGYVEFEDFRTFAEGDATLITWFETLGSIF